MPMIALHEEFLGCVKMTEKIYNLIEKAAKTGKIDKGVNETTKAVERGVAKVVVVASDVEPKEIIQHIPILCNEKKIKFFEVDSKQKLGIAAKINVPCTAVAIIELGEAKLEEVA